MSQDHQKKKPKETIYYVKGMHCASCEVLIEKALLEKPQVVAADISISNKSAKIYVERGKYVDIAELNNQFKEDGYEFSKEPFLEEEVKLFSYKDGKLVIDKRKLKSALKTLLVLFSFIVVFAFVEKLQLGRFVSVDTSSSLIAFFLLGLVAGLSSCAALIGGVLLSLIKHWNELYLGESQQARKTPHLLFHLGRIISFIVLGGLLGLLGDVISLDNTYVYSGLVLVISFIMLILALQMLGISWAQKWKFRLPKFITRFAANEKAFAGKHMPFITGALTFFLPCGFTLIAQGVALTTGSFFGGAMIMLFFALGTLPILVGISYTGLVFTKKPHLTAKFSVIAGLIVLFFALYNINGQLNVLGLPSASDINLKSLVEIMKEDVSTKPEISVDANGNQLVNIIAKEFSYIPTGPTILKAGTPTKLVVDNQGVLGCGAFIAARGLITNYVSLAKGVNTIDLGSPKAGTYKLTCSMGMVPPVTLKFN
jgi:sulfite exporter TauE/SafE/copper chaperone CopZ